ncbi:MAG: hypothetical protein HKP32_10140 [Woeseia sp.]|nr:hypothetical protein [Woeseia sp.]
MLKNKLLACDVPAASIEIVTDEQEATQHGLEVSEPGDLLLILGDNIKRCWKQIIYFNATAHVHDEQRTSTASIDLPDAEDFQLDEDLEIISDERGVRIAREAGD